MWRRVAQLLRAGLAGLAATGSDLATLAVCVSLLHVDPRLASLPALLVGGVVNFVGNRRFAFRARQGNLGKQALGYTVVEVVALGLNGLLYDSALRMLAGAPAVYWLVRLATSHLVFLAWSYPLWTFVFRVKPTQSTDRAEGSATIT